MAETVIMPKLGFDMAEGTLVRWVKSEGDPVTKGDVLAEIETDKATVEVESSFGGVVVRHLVEKGTIVPVGTPIAVIAAPGEKVQESPSATPTNASISPAGSSAPALDKPSNALKELDGEQIEAAPVQVGLVFASPLARKMAHDNNLDLTMIRGSGPGGRIVQRDIEQTLISKPAPAAIPSVSAAAPGVSHQTGSVPSVVSIPTPLGSDQVVPLERLRAAIGRRMVEAKLHVPHFYVTHDYNMAAVMDLRKQLNAYLPEDQKLSVNDFIVKAVALTLRDFPNINATLSGNQIIRHAQINVGVAVAIEAGLLTVVVRQAEQKGIVRLSGEMRDLVARARVGKVRPEDIEGSTFSISNLGMFDVDSFIAIINPPETAILAIGSVKQVPVVVDGQVVPGTRMKATLSADHRVTDGVEAARFLQALSKYLEEPIRLMLL